MRASTYPLVDADEAAALVLEHTAVLPKERVAIVEAVGRVLAEDLSARSELPFESPTWRAAPRVLMSIQ